jgi:hypothetical protein
MINKSIAVLLILRATLSTCSLGCLKCGDYDKCLFCDAKARFSVSSGSCVRTTDANCIEVNDLGECLACDAPKYFLDTTTSKCVAIPSGQVVESCLVHSGPSKCLVCSPDKFVKPGDTSDTCSAVSKKIDNCQVHKSDTACSDCLSGFFVNKQGTCSQLSSDNCMLFSEFKCQRCSQGFDSNPAMNLLGLQTASFDPFFLQELAAQISKPGFAKSSFRNCQSVSHCRRFHPSTFTCIECFSGFYFDKTLKACAPNPTVRTIEDCKTYETLTSCAVCQKGVLALDRKSCISEVELPGCATFGYSNLKIVCLSCVPGMFLHFQGHCYNRLFPSIANCKSLGVFFDGCQECKDGFVKTSDQGACLPKIGNCVGYGGQRRSVFESELCALRAGVLRRHLHLPLQTGHRCQLHGLQRELEHLRHLPQNPLKSLLDFVRSLAESGQLRCA